MRKKALNKTRMMSKQLRKDVGRSDYKGKKMLYVHHSRI
jgi:hypothetical protein